MSLVVQPEKAGMKLKYHLAPGCLTSQGILHKCQVPVQKRYIKTEPRVTIGIIELQLDPTLVKIHLYPIVGTHYYQFTSLQLLQFGVHSLRENLMNRFLQSNSIMERILAMAVRMLSPLLVSTTTGQIDSLKDHSEKLMTVQG